MRETIRKAASLFTPDARRRITVILGALGLLLIFLSGFVHTDEDNITQNDTDTQIQTEQGDGHRKALERELGEIVSAIDGAGDVRIFITMDTTTEDIYAVDTTKSETAGTSAAGAAHSEENEYVVIRGKDGSERTVLRKQRLPEIRGVLVVCGGGGSSVVKEKITSAVAGALGIPRSKVFVTN